MSFGGEFFTLKGEGENMRNNGSLLESHRKPENSKMKVPSYNNGKRPSVLL
jgi:hypothetical protein